MNEEYFKTNRRLWDAKTLIHKDSDFYYIADWKKGTESLNKFELDAIGDVSGKSLLHLQCHFGQDTLSWERLGATVTGVDFSPEAIDLAREITEELGMNATFVESNVLELDKNLEGKFDIVFTSYGTIGWLPDLTQWAKIINHFLKPGGIFYIIDFHPLLYMFDWESQKLTFPYFNAGAFSEEEQGTYADPDADIKMKEYFWQHSLSETMSALLNEGLQLLDFQEFKTGPYNTFPNMEEVEDGLFYFGKKELQIPQLFSIKVKKPIS